MTTSDPHGTGFQATGPFDAMSAHLARNWWALALRGVIAIIFGIAAFFATGATILSLALLFGIYLIVDGIFAIVAALRAAQSNERWGWLVVEGVLDLVMGVIALLFPVSAVLAFVLIVAAWSLLSGIALIAAAFRLRPDHGRWWMALSGVVSVIFGVLLALSPLIGAVVLTWWLGAYALVFGVLLLALSFRLRGLRAA